MVRLPARGGGSVTEYLVDGVVDPLVRARIAGYADVLAEHFLRERRDR